MDNSLDPEVIGEALADILHAINTALQTRLSTLTDPTAKGNEALLQMIALRIQGMLYEKIIAAHSDKNLDSIIQGIAQAVIEQVNLTPEDLKVDNDSENSRDPANLN